MKPSVSVVRETPGKNGARYVELSVGHATETGGHDAVASFEVYVPAGGFPRMPETKFGRVALRLAGGYQALVQRAIESPVGSVLQ